LAISAAFRDWITREVDTVLERYPILSDRGRAFEAWALTYVHDLDSDVALDHCDTVTIGDGGIDGWVSNSELESFYIFQAKWSDQLDRMKFSPTLLRDLFAAYPVLLNPQLAEKYGSAAKEISLEIQGYLAAGWTPTLQMFLAGSLSARARQQLIALAESLPGAGNTKPELEIWDIDRLYEHFVATETADDLSGKTLSFSLAKTGVLEWEPDSVAGVGQAVVVTLDIKSFAAAVRPHIPEIFDANVRHHLGPTNKVNKSIRASLESPAGRAGFWLYNNGLTILAETFELAPGEASINVRNPQIVNGCQTTQAIVDRLPSLTEGEAQVLARVIRLDAGDVGEDQALLIAEKTNSQSPVRAADLKSNRPEQEQLRRRCWARPLPCRSLGAGVRSRG
jgi:hypothetical protein